MICGSNYWCLRMRLWAACESQILLVLEVAIVRSDFWTLWLRAVCIGGAGIKGIWSLKSSSMDAYDTYLVLTFVGETRILAISAEDELDEAEIDGFNNDTQVQSRNSIFRVG